MKISEPPEDWQTLTSSLENFPVSLLVSPKSDKALPMSEAICSLHLWESLKPKDLDILYLKMLPDYWRLKRGKLSAKYLECFQNWGIVWNGLCITAPALVFHSQEKESTLQDVLEQTVLDKYWLSEKSTRKIAGKSDN